MDHQLKRIHIETSTVCNTDCLICPQALIRRPKKIDVARVKRLIAEDALVYKNTLDLFEFHNYNEPLLYFDLFCELSELVNGIYGTERVGLVTNASVMDAAKVGRLLTLGLKHVIFSVDGFSKAIYEAHRPGLDRDEVYGNIDHFIDRSAAVGGPVPLINYVVTEANAKDKDAARAHFQGRRCVFHMSACDGRGEDGGKLTAIRNMASACPCDYALDGAYILSNLDLVACCEDWSGREILGNLKNHTLQEIVDGPAYGRFRDLHFAGRKREIAVCRDCKTNMSYADNDLKTVR